MIRIADALERIAESMEADRAMHEVIRGVLQSNAPAEPQPVDWFRDNEGTCFIRYSDGRAVRTTLEAIRKAGLA